MNKGYPASILKIIDNAHVEEVVIGCSDSKVYKIVSDKVYYLKISSKTLIKEYNALKWLDGKLNVPRVIVYESVFGKDYLLTSGMNGKMLSSSEYTDNPDLVINSLVKAFKEIKDVDISNCPFKVGLSYKLELVTNNVLNGLISDEYIPSEILDKYNGVSGILDYLLANRFDEELCFSHGDVSFPNIFIDKDVIGFIDLGDCGIADKWFDLALCEKSLIRNLGIEYVDVFYKRLNIVPDRFKIDYYLLMMNLYL